MEDDSIQTTEQDSFLDGWESDSPDVDFDPDEIGRAHV